VVHEERFEAGDGPLRLVVRQFLDCGLPGMVAALQTFGSRIE